MEELLIIDGYNVINAWSVLKELGEVNLEAARDKLIEMMQDYQGYRGHRVVIVFDAHLVRNNPGKVEQAGRVEVVYTKEGETADHYIERLVDIHQGHMTIRVVTSDRVEQTIIMGRGAIRISAREMEIEMERMRVERNREFIENEAPKQHPLESRLHPHVLEQFERWRRQK
ncbi:MAG: NYN domain-containing protein [Clostridia bacterium]